MTQAKQLNTNFVSFIVTAMVAAAAIIFLPLMGGIKTAEAAGRLNVWWPVPDATLSGHQPFKAMLEGDDAGNYEMFWQVDGGQWNWMDTSNTDYPHKEASVELSGWSWNPTGHYKLNFIARRNGTILAEQSVPITVNAPVTVNTPIPTPVPTISIQPTPNITPYTTPHVTPQTTPISTPVSTPAPTPVQSTPVPTPIYSATPISVPVVTTRKEGESNPLSSLALYVDPNSNAAKQANVWRISRPADAWEMDKIAREPQARWFGDWNKDIENDVRTFIDSAANLNMVPTLIAYNVPDRDCNNYSAGGSNTANAYLSWIDNLAKGIGSRSAIVVLEPDGLSLINCLSEQATNMRFSLIKQAVAKLKALGRTIVYIDAGHSNWINAVDMSKRLVQAGISAADGFALNVSNFYRSDNLINYGEQLSSLLKGKHFVIDTSRNGLGENGNWCNPEGRALGHKPTTVTGNKLVDAFLWLKSPGESDGACNGGPNAGVWWPDYALGLAKRSDI